MGRKMKVSGGAGRVRRNSWPTHAPFIGACCHMPACGASRSSLQPHPALPCPSPANPPHMIQMRGILCMDTMARSKQLFSASTEGWLGARPRTASSRSLR